MKNVILYLICIILISACSDQKTNTQKIEHDEVVLMNYQFRDAYNNVRLMDKLTDSLLRTGDTELYVDLLQIFFLSEHSYEFLYYAMFMAEEYNYRHAYIDVYLILEDVEHYPAIPPKMKDLGKYYLLKSYQLGDTTTLYTIKRIFGNDIDKTKIDKLLDRYNFKN